MPQEDTPLTPDEGQPEDPRFSLEDISEHSVTYGVDIYPAIDPARETSRAHNCFLQLREKYPALFDTLTAGSQFAISSSFSGSSRVRFPWMTFGVNPRGPVFQFPVKGVHFGGDVDLHSLPELDTVFLESLEIVLANFPRKVMKVGVTRQFVFNTGDVNCGPWLASKVLNFGDADLVSSQCNLMYKCTSTNFPMSKAIQMASVEIQTNAMAMNQGNPQPMLVRPHGQEFGLAATFMIVSDDRDLPLEGHEIQAVLVESHSLLPAQIIEFLNSRNLK